MTTTVPGVMALPEGGRVDFGRLRADRRRRVFDAMDRADLDALILGRPADIQYVSGARQLWTAGGRPFGPGCIVIRSTGRVHLLSVWDEGVPAEIDRSDLFGLSWNPATIAASVAAVPGVAAARRIGTDSLSPGFPHLLASIAPSAVIVDAGPALWSARATKTPDEVAAIITATAIAEAALAAMMAALTPGATPQMLLGVYLSTIATMGAPTPPTEAVVRPAGGGPIAAGDLVTLDPGALYAGYEGGVGRTCVVGGSPSAAQVQHAADRGAALDAVIAACRPGATGSDLRAAWTGRGLPLPVAPLVHGLGLGMEPPVVGPAGLGDTATLEEGMVLSVSGGLERDTVLVAADGPRVLSRVARGLR